MFRSGASRCCSRLTAGTTNGPSAAGVRSIIRVAVGREGAGVGLVRPGRGGVEDDPDLLEAGQADQAVDAVGRRRDAEPARPGEAVGGRIDADHRRDLEPLAEPEHLDHQVGADVARADDRRLGPAGHDATAGEDGADLPEPADVGREGVARGHRDHRPERAGQHDLAGPERRPRSRTPRPATRRRPGDRRMEAPVPVEPQARRARPARVARSPAAPPAAPRRKVIAQSARSRPTGPLSPVAEHEQAGGAVVGDRVDDADVPAGDPAVHDLQRGDHVGGGGGDLGRAESRRRSGRRPARRRSRPRSWAAAARPLSIGVPGAHAMLSNSTPKSGRSTPNCACTAGLVSPILRPTTRPPAAIWPVDPGGLHRVGGVDVAGGQQSAHRGAGPPGRPRGDQHVQRLRPRPSSVPYGESSSVSSPRRSCRCPCP